MTKDKASRPGRKRRRARAWNWSVILTDAQAQGRTIAEVVQRTGATLPTVRRNAKALEITLPAASSARKHIDWRLEFERARTRGETASQLARRLKVGLSSVDKAKAQLGANLPAAEAGRRLSIDWQAAFLCARANGEHLSALARRLGVARQTVSVAAKRLGVTLNRKRPRSPR